MGEKQPIKSGVCTNSKTKCGVIPQATFAFLNV